jgi:hypothetical protein
VEDADLEFYWSRYVGEDGQEYAGEGYRLTIDEVTSFDLYKDLKGNLLNNYYECTMKDYEHHGWTTSTVFYINEVCAHKKYKETVKKAATTKAAGTLSKKCTVCGNISTATIPKIASVTLTTTSYTYNGSAKKPKVKVTDSKGKEIASKYYTVKYTDNKNSGKATVQITFNTRYKGTVKKTFTINPKGTSISSLTAKSKGFVVKWKAQTTQMTGYQVQYSTSSKFSSTKTLTAGKTKTSLTVSSLKASKVYYVRVRTYKTVGGKKYYSAWSTAKKVTTKK